MRMRVHDAILLTAHGASAHLAGKVLLQRLCFRRLKHVRVLDHGQPERGQVVVVVATADTRAFDDGRGAELLQARSGRDQILAITASVVGGVLEGEKKMLESHFYGNMCQLTM